MNEQGKVCVASVISKRRRVLLVRVMIGFPSGYVLKLPMRSDCDWSQSTQLGKQLLFSPFSLSVHVEDYTT